MIAQLQTPDTGFEFLNGPVEQVAPRLLGCVLTHEANGQLLSGRIVETEAYDQADAASHSYRGETPRTSVMFGPAGFLYVYFTYGMHYCCNVVVGAVGHGAAVLIRALEPLEGLEQMRSNRHSNYNYIHSYDQRQRSASKVLPDTHLTNGPAKLCQALKIDKACNGANLQNGNVRLLLQKPLLPQAIIQTKRIGISQAKDIPWRFYSKDNPYVSKIV